MSDGCLKVKWAIFSAISWRE